MYPTQTICQARLEISRSKCKVISAGKPQRSGPASECDKMASHQGEREREKLREQERLGASTATHREDRRARNQPASEAKPSKPNHLSDLMMVPVGCPCDSATNLIGFNTQCLRPPRVTCYARCDADADLQIVTPDAGETGPQTSRAPLPSSPFCSRETQYTGSYSSPGTAGGSWVAIIWGSRGFPVTLLAFQLYFPEP